MDGRTFGEPALLDRASDALGSTAPPVAASIDAYRLALRRLASAASDVPLPSVDRTAALEDRLATLRRLAPEPAAFAAALRALDRFVPDTPTDRRWLATRDLDVFDRYVDHLLRFPDATTSELRSIHPDAEAAREHLLQLLDGGWFGPTARDLDELAERIERLSPDVLDGVLAGMSDRELASLVSALEGSWVPGSGWDRDRRHELWTVIARKVELDTFLRLAAHTDDLDPPPSTAIDDAASGREQDQAWFDEVVYRDLDGWLWWHGDDDAHRIDRTDLSQGRLGNCYLIAGMMAIADHDPAALQQALTRNANGTVTVRFADGTEVTVAPTVPVHPDEDRPVFAGRALDEADRDVPGGGYELWPLLLEKAYAQRHGGWGDIAGGWPGQVIVELVGGEHEAFDEVDLTAIGDHLDDGAVVTFATLPSGRTSEEGRDLYAADPQLTGQHAYVVDGIDHRGRLVLINPWNPQAPPVRLTPDEADHVGWRVEVNRLP
jgi:hypothetical protein